MHASRAKHSCPVLHVSGPFGQRSRFLRFAWHLTCKCICWSKPHCRCEKWDFVISHWWLNLQFGAPTSENPIFWVSNITILCTSVMRSTLLQFRLLVGPSGKNLGFSDLRDISLVNASVDRSLIVNVRHDISSFLMMTELLIRSFNIWKPHCLSQ